MEKLIGLNEWILDEAISDKERLAEASIYLIYPDLGTLKDLLPKERKKRIDLELRERFRELTDRISVKEYSLLGTKKRPIGIKTTLTFDALKDISTFDCIWHIFINKISSAKKRRVRASQSFYFIKMTVAIEIEGLQKGMQTFEERFVIVKAKSQDDAYQKMEKQKKNYVKPYLNSDGRQVRWRIESFDDCYETGVDKLSDFNNPEGVEVYSKLKSRKLTPERIWDGK
ncbi:DUF4288 domain-containing protein [Pararhodonellum marinum]|uniref:DUF4288 domain-containing protein n=1 Tax=Pararhodonellum marinum TaxID=2755358 RepID=UPI00188F1F73|nr:DUF4288 domain-containing protein [Pararhodonellum marinum]